MPAAACEKVRPEIAGTAVTVSRTKNTSLVSAGVFCEWPRRMRFQPASTARFTVTSTDSQKPGVAGGNALSSEMTRPL